MNKAIIKRPIYGVLRILDVVRRTCLWYLSPWLNPFIRNRALRICVTACVGIVLAFFFSLSFPLWQLLLGPLLLGIPHVVGDVRYLLLHKRLHQKSWFWWCGVLPLLLYAITGTVYYAMLGVFLASLYTQRQGLERYIVQACSLCLFLISLHWPRHFLFAFLHAHNVIAIGIWWFWSKNRKYWEVVPLLLCGLGCVGLVVFGADHTLNVSHHPPSLDMEYYHHAIAYLVQESWQTTTVLLFAFLQSVHYLVWIRLIPEEARKQPTPRGFRKSFDALSFDFGFALLLGIGLVFVLFIGYGMFSPESARRDYLTLISFHGFLELFVLAYQSPRRNHDLDHGIHTHTGD